MKYSPFDKNYLAVLAIPMVLSIVLGLSGDLAADPMVFEDGEARSGMEESESGKRSETLRISDEDLEDSQDQAAGSGDNSNKRHLLQAAIEAADYDAFIKASESTPFAEIMTKEAFAMLVEEYAMRKEGYLPTSLDNLS